MAQIQELRATSRQRIAELAARIAQLERGSSNACKPPASDADDSVVMARYISPRLREMAGPGMAFKPIPRLIGGLNRHLVGWANYFGDGYPRRAFRAINCFVRERPRYHLRRRSQRPYRPPKGVTLYAHLQRVGLVSL